MPLVQWTSDVTVPDETGLQIWTNDKAYVFRAAGLLWTVFAAACSCSPNRRHAQVMLLKESLAGECSLWPSAQAPWIPLFTLPSVTAVANDVRGFRMLPAAWWDLEYVWLKK